MYRDDADLFERELQLRAAAGQVMQDLRAGDWQMAWKTHPVAVAYRALLQEAWAPPGAPPPPRPKKRGKASVPKLSATELAEAAKQLALEYPIDVAAAERVICDYGGVDQARAFLEQWAPRHTSLEQQMGLPAASPGLWGEE